MIPFRRRFPLRRAAAALCAYALTASLSVSHAGPKSGAYDFTGSDWIRQRAERREAASASAALIRRAHERLDQGLRAAPEARPGQVFLLDHLQRGSGSLPSGTWSPLTSDERRLYDEAGVRAKICGPWLVTYIDPDADGDIGWVQSGEVRTAGKLAWIEGGSVENWGREDPPPADFAGCSLPDRAPARITRWRAPAMERRETLTSERRVLDCPAGEVGSGIRQRRELRGVRDGHGAEKASEENAGAWEETGRDCRVPRTFTRTVMHDCRTPMGETAVRVVRYPETERRVPDDPRKTEIVTDWGSPSTVQDFCGGGPSEEVTVSRGVQIDRRTWNCARAHGNGWPLGEQRHKRERHSADYAFPASWGRGGQRVEAVDPWWISYDDCRREEPRSRNYRERTGGCAAGLIGSGHYNHYRDDWLQIVFAAPVPHRASYEKPGSRTKTFTGSVSDCRTPPPRNGDGGGGNDNYHYEDQYGNRFSTDRGCPDCERRDYGGSTHTSRAHMQNTIDEYNNRPTRTGPRKNPDTGRSERSSGNDNSDGSSSSGGCYLTTAVTKLRGEPDSGPTLTALRRMRDGYLARLPEGPALIAEYERIAPRIVAAVPDGHDEWKRIALDVDEARDAILADDDAAALEVYIRMTRRLKAAWLTE